MSAFSATDYASHLSELAGNPDAGSVSAADEPEEFAAGVYRPGVFYFRRAIRESDSLFTACAIAETVAGEIEHTLCWLQQHEFPAPSLPTWLIMRRTLRDCACQETAIALALLIVGDLENLRAWLAKEGLPIPKKMVHCDEAKARGWSSGVGRRRLG